MANSSPLIALLLSFFNYVIMGKTSCEFHQLHGELECNGLNISWIPNSTNYGVFSPKLVQLLELTDQPNLLELTETDLQPFPNLVEIRLTNTGLEKIENYAFSY